MSTSNNCPLCKKHEKEDSLLILKGEYWNLYAGPFESQVQGYLYLEPLRHVENWGEFTSEELTVMAKTIPTVERALKQRFNIERLYVVTISEAVRHIHLHLIPRVGGQELIGIPLITQATQQKTRENNLSFLQYQEDIHKLKKSLEEIVI